jgi:hypothetical protein
VDLQNWPHQNFIIQKKKEEEAEKEEISAQCAVAFYVMMRF